MVRFNPTISPSGPAIDGTSVLSRGAQPLQLAGDRSGLAGLPFTGFGTTLYVVATRLAIIAVESIFAIIIWSRFEHS